MSIGGNLIKFMWNNDQGWHKRSKTYFRMTVCVLESQLSTAPPLCETHILLGLWRSLQRGHNECKSCPPSCGECDDIFFLSPCTHTCTDTNTHMHTFSFHAAVITHSADSPAPFTHGLGNKHKACQRACNVPAILCHRAPPPLSGENTF